MSGIPSMFVAVTVHGKPAITRFPLFEGQWVDDYDPERVVYINIPEGVLSAEQVHFLQTSKEIVRYSLHDRE
jgi:hypothetical protein